MLPEHKTLMTLCSVQGHLPDKTKLGLSPLVMKVRWIILTFEGETYIG